MRPAKVTSIKKKVRLSFFVIIALMLVLPLTTIGSSLFQSSRYDHLIANVDKTNRLNQIVRSDVANEIWDIVAGNKKFSEGKQYTIIDGIDKSLADIMTTTDVRGNRQLLEVAERAVLTLRGYVDRLGAQMERGFPVRENEKILDEIRGVSSLISDILQQFIVLEIEAAAQTNAGFKLTVRLLAILQLGTVFCVTLFSFLAQRSVSVSINRPIQELESLSTSIASGDLTARATPPRVAELDNLTENLNIMAGKIRELIDANTREQRNMQKSEMRALQAQITPHFLYNTLDTIVWLAEGQQYEKVIEVTRSFSNFFRTSLSDGKDWIPVSQEINHARSYLAIQKIRYGDILEYEVDFEPDMGDYLVLKLILQPIVENALYHGIKNKRGRGRLRVRGWREGERLCFSVDDDGIGMTEERLAEVRKRVSEDGELSGSSDMYGLYNVSKRLRLYYSGAAELSIQSQYRVGTTVTYKIPEATGNV
jgi:two-component system sensor histidine kinase YesM